ncbi:guanine nucleotide-binding protein subunit gamma [Dehalococcoidales bacterium]|nr:guanine nucleotide-binding protein subunit gamma [Dehalococcoidales bacterium]
MARVGDKMDRLRKELEEQGINVSEDALFIASYTGRNEIRDTRNITVFGILFGITIGLIIAFGIAINLARDCLYFQITPGNSA